MRIRKENHVAKDFYHHLDLNVKVENGPLAADMNLKASKEFL